MTDVSVRLIDYTGNGHPDPLFAARLLAYTKDTRLQSDPSAWDVYFGMGKSELMEKIEYVANSIRSPWEIVSFTFHVTGITRACANQMTRTRHASFAQAAMRVVDMSGDNFKVTTPETVKKNRDYEFLWDAIMDNVKNGYEDMVDAGIPHQDARGILPLHIQTSLVGKYDLRCLADVVGKRANLRVQGEYNEVAAQMVENVLRVMPWTNQFLFPDRKATPSLDRIMRDLLGDAGPLDKPQINEALKEIDKLKGTWG